MAGEEAGRRRPAPVEVVAAEEMMGTALWWRNSAAVMGFSRCGWRLEGKWGCCDLAGVGGRWKGTAGMERDVTAAVQPLLGPNGGETWRWK